MWKKAVTLSIVIAAMALVGCGDKFTCENMSKKNKKCMDEIVNVFAKGADKMPEKMKKKMVEGLKKSFTGEKFVKMCKKNIGKEGNKEDAEKVKKCFKKSDCKEYAKCLKGAM